MPGATRTGSLSSSAATAERGIQAALTAWCLQVSPASRWSLEETCLAAKRLGLTSVEVVQPEELATLKAHGLVCGLTSSHGYVRGMNNPLHWEECLGRLRLAIEASAANGHPNVVTFSGFGDTTREEDGTPYSGGSVVSREEGIRNCVEGYKKVVGLAEAKGVNICLEPLNTRDPGPMKGHPGYQGATLDYCLEVMRKVGSPRLKLLFDAYHVQIMEGDLIRRIGEIGGEAIGHVQVAGVPGRHELDEEQEVNWRAVIGALERAGYRGYVGLEFLPTRDPMESLEQALEALGLGPA
jgi:hydroxypyruvate isomerase